MSRDPVHDTYRQDLPDDPARPRRHRPLRFGVTLRGYAMAQVDDVLDRLARGDRRARRRDRRADGRRPTARVERRRPPTEHRRRSELVSVRLEVSAEIAAPIDRVWDELVDWPGQSRWIPFTTVRITTPHEAGLGVRASALSGFWLGRLPVGLLDRFVVTGWTPPRARTAAAAELEVLHLGPYFTGVGVFRLRATRTGTTVTLRRAVRPAGWRLLEPVGPAAAAGAARVGSAQPAAVRGRLRVDDRAAARPGRPAALLLGAVGAPEYLDYHDHEWGLPVTERGRAVRAAEPGGLPVRPVLDHHPAQAGGLPRRLRRLRPGAGRPIRRGRRRAADDRSGHRAQPGQDRAPPSPTPGWWPGWATSSPRMILRYAVTGPAAADRGRPCGRPHRSRWRWPGS